MCFKSNRDQITWSQYFQGVVFQHWMISSLLQKTSEHNVNGNQSSYPLYIHVNPIYYLEEMTEIQTYYLLRDIL